MNEPQDPLWADIGPKSQGKIITAILQGRTTDAVSMLWGWNRKDRESLRLACLEVARQISYMNAAD